MISAAEGAFFRPVERREVDEKGQVGAGEIFCNFSKDVIGNIARRVIAGYEALFDAPKQAFCSGQATFWQILNSVTSLKEKQGPWGQETTELRRAVAANCASIQELVAVCAGNIITVVNPNSCTYSKFVDTRELPEVCGGRITSRRFALMELLREEPKEIRGQEERDTLGDFDFVEEDSVLFKKSFSQWQGNLIASTCFYRGGNFFKNWVVQELGGRAVAVGTASLAIIIAVASVALGAVAFTFALVLALVKNISDLVIYTKNGGGRHDETYCCYNSQGHFYELYGEMGSIEENNVHLTFERLTQFVTLFAIDNLAEAATLVNQAHTLGLGLLRPRLLVQ